jgi:hypothetical protein
MCRVLRSFVYPVQWMRLMMMMMMWNGGEEAGVVRNECEEDEGTD